MWYYIGRFSYKSRYDPSDNMREVDKEIEREKDSWPLLAAGLFDGGLKKLSAARDEIDTRARSMGF